MTQIDFNKVNEQMDAGYIKAQRHPRFPLTVYNYSAKAQFDWVWTPETRACRGLIVDDHGWIVARPFEKFFSIEQMGDTPLPLEPFDVYEKLDGSLGIFYFYEDEGAIATRGSFVSDQALRATEILNSRYGHVGIDKHLTYCFEIILPENRIVIDYGDKEDLVLLAVFHTLTGKELPLSDFAEIGFPVVTKYDGITDFHCLKEREERNREGFVVRFQSGLRIKVKFDEYKRLHKLITGINPRHIWEELRAGRSLDDLVERVPDEYFQWVKAVERDLLSHYTAIETQANSDFRSDFPTRKDAALYFQTCKHPSILFSKMDSKDYSQRIWRMIRPEAAAAFRCDIDQS